MNTKKVAIGSHVVFNAEYQALNPDLVNAIFEVRDARLCAPGYGFSLAPVTEPAATNCVFFDVKASSLVVVGE